ncbi:hypothetical protein EPR50_G00223940 [Perca flavescens]|uniref:Uncharacterized protein n=2 Tax=Perca flavescens TaxID=8167 RepID=A0A484C0G1_PERFV|nr:uncharacterized protein LOC114549150 isoform X1 [Perca flavescens]TDG97188.1 hypothetical protein EPR50_G00223940 [Perca flavescens]
MMTFQVNASLPNVTAKALLSERSSNCSQRGPDAARYPAYWNVGMGAGGGQAAVRQNSQIRRTLPVIQPLSKSRDWKTLVSGYIVRGSPDLAKDDRLGTEINGPEKDLSGRHFLFDKQCARLERTRTVIPPMARDYHVHRPGNQHPLSLSKKLSHSHAGRPFDLGYPERYELNTTPSILFPSTLVLKGRNTFSAENCQLSRPKVNYPTYNPLTVKDNQKSQSYPDPVVGASRSFIHRISELSTLEGETVRQEKLKKMRKAKKPSS